MTHLIGPGLAHKFPPEWQKKAEGLIREHLESPRAQFPASERFVTYTAKNGRGRSLHIIAQETSYEQSSADYTRTGRTVVILTKNVLGLALPFDVRTEPEQLTIDGKSVSLEKARSELTVTGWGRSRAQPLFLRLQGRRHLAVGFAQTLERAAQQSSLRCDRSDR